MSRYIDAEYCEDFFDRWESEVKDAEPVTIDVVQNTRTLLREAPSIDIEPKRGEWIEINIKDYKAKCSHCGIWSPIMGNFCPNCGCAMRGKDDE